MIYSIPGCVSRKKNVEKVKELMWKKVNISVYLPKIFFLIAWDFLYRFMDYNESKISVFRAFRGIISALLYV